MPNKKRPDRLSALIKRFRVEAKVLPIDVTSGPNERKPYSTPNLFIVGKGRLNVSREHFPDLDVEAPVLVFFPRNVPVDFKVLTDDAANAEYVCASVNTGGDANPIALALPDVVTVALDEANSLQAVTDILLDEALAPRCGGRAVIDRLCEIVVIQLLRHLIETGKTQVGLLGGLAHQSLFLAIVSIHDNPEKNWRLEDLANISAMSRTHFANTFRDVVGVTPGAYLTSWRLTLARVEIAKGSPVKVVARRVGFSSSAALSRAFTRRYGLSPKQEHARSA